MHPTTAIVGSGDFLRDQGHAAPDIVRARNLLSNEVDLLVEAHGSIEIARRAGLTVYEIEQVAAGHVSDWSVAGLKAVVSYAS
ncbi:hypothetical protein [Hansschlegelia sp. KR7-227]|uniref:hypothetical protein n=1 Tax=Hansschlegelia sp. KR7-227 TaxID=3400914 RepID=UPI003C11FD3C